MTDSRRFQMIPVENLTADQKVVYDAIRGGPRAKVANSGASKPGPLGGPFNVMLRSPGVGNIVQALGGEIRFKSSIPNKLNELAIMVTARYWTSQYEWHAHCKPALEAGLNPEIAKDVAENRRPANMDADEAIVYDFARELADQFVILRRGVCTFKEKVDAMIAKGAVGVVILQRADIIAEPDTTSYPPFQGPGVPTSSRC